MSAREEGNAAFRKGRWGDAAAAYTRAVEEAAGDPVPLANRAMAWLKLERYQDAAADATQALALDIAPALAQKARYRRALARRGMGDLPGARGDLEEVLRVDKGNEAARGELEEVMAELARGGGKSGERAGESKTALAGRSDSQGVKNVKSAEEKSTSEETTDKSKTASPLSTTSKPATTRPDPTRGANVRTAPPTRTPNSSALLDEELAPSPSGSKFASLRRERPSYVRPSQPASSTSPSTLNVANGPTGPDTTRSAPPSAPAAPAPRTPRAPADPTSTAPGAGLALLRALGSIPPAERTAYLRHYAPDVISRIVAPVLEPDGLGLLLAAVAGSDDQSWAGEVLQGLKRTPRWKMNVAMLSRKEKEVGKALGEKLGIAFP